MALITPLHDIEAAHGARFTEFFAWEVPDHYGDLTGEYNVLCRSVGVMDLSYQGKLCVSGRDRVRFLHNMLSNNIKALELHKGCQAALLTHRGLIEADLCVYALEDELILECLPSSWDHLYEVLNKFVVGDAVEFQDLTQRMGIISLQGPEALQAVERFLDIKCSDMEFLELRIIERSGDNWIVVHRDRTGRDGYDLWLPAEEISQAWLRLVRDDGILPVGNGSLNRLRLEAGIPWYGIDMNDKTLPLEVGLDSAVSMTKGCYRGQEIMARIKHRGHLDRKLAGVAVEHDEVPESGAGVISGGIRVGRITSAVLSPILGRPLALAILNQGFLRPGTPVEVEYGRQLKPGEVVALPLIAG